MSGPLCPQDRPRPLLACCLALLLCLGLLSGAGVLAQEAPQAAPPSEQGAEEENAAAEEAQSPPVEEVFAFLGVGPEAHIDPTRKAEYPGYNLNLERVCTGCWCNNVFGDGLSESYNELVGKSEAFRELWSLVARCIDPAVNSMPQIRTLPLDADYDDAEFAKVTLYFSEFTDTLLAMRLVVNTPETTLATLRERFGEPEDIEGLWYLWQRPASLLLLDLFKVKRHQWPQAELLVVHTELLAGHLVEVLSQARTAP